MEEIDSIQQALGIDSKCYRILSLMISQYFSEDNPVRFNELYRKVTDRILGIKISTPSFNEHLNHLIEKGYVIRKEKGKQNVIYYLSKLDEITDFRAALEDAREFYQWLNNTFQKMSFKDQIEVISDFFAMSYLAQLQIGIENISTLSKNKKLQFQIIANMEYYRTCVSMFTGRMMNMIEKNKEIIPQRLKEIESFLDNKGKTIDNIVSTYKKERNHR